jgi:hypothetical protein
LEKARFLVVPAFRDCSLIRIPRKRAARERPATGIRDDPSAQFQMFLLCVIARPASSAAAISESATRLFSSLGGSVLLGESACARTGGGHFVRNDRLIRTISETLHRERAYPSVADFEDEIDLDGRIERQDGNAHGNPRVAALLTEYIGKEL